MTRSEFDAARAEIKEQIDILERRDAALVAKYLSEHDLNAFIGQIIQVGCDLPFYFESLSMEGNFVWMHGKKLKKDGSVSKSNIKKLVRDDERDLIHNAEHISLNMMIGEQKSAIDRCLYTLGTSERIDKGYVYTVILKVHNKLRCMNPVWLSSEEKDLIYKGVFGQLPSDGPINGEKYQSIGNNRRYGKLLLEALDKYKNQTK